MANQPYLDLSRIIHEYEACGTRRIWREIFGRKRVTKEMFLEAIQDDKIARTLFCWCDWFANNALLSVDDRLRFFDFLHTSCNKTDERWREVMKTVRGIGGDAYWGAYEKIYAETYRACLTLLCELWFAQEEGKKNG